VKTLRDGRPFPAKNSGGKTVLTDQRLSLYASWFENRFGLFPEIKNFSLSAEGLAIKGLEIAEGEEVLALPRRREEINSLLGKTFARVTNEFAPGEALRAEQYKKALRTLLDGLWNIKSVAEDSSDMAETFCRRFKSRHINAGEEGKVLKKLDSANQSIMNSAVREVAGFLFPDPEELEKDLPKDEQNPLLRHLEFSIRFYRALTEAAEYNLGVLSVNNEK
jgi:hypothetical protein